MEDDALKKVLRMHQVIYSEKKKCRYQVYRHGNNQKYLYGMIKSVSELIQPFCMSVFNQLGNTFTDSAENFFGSLTLVHVELLS